MAFPEPTPPVKGKAAKEFVERLDSFRLTRTQRTRWAEFRKVKKTLK